MENVTKVKEEGKQTNKIKKTLDVIFYVVLALLLILASFALASRFTKGRIGNSQYLVVISSSMDGEEQIEYDIKTIPVKSLVKVELVQNDNFYSELKKGDVITFNYLPLNNNTITHRIVEDPVLLDDGTYKYVVKGDAVDTDTQTLYSDGRTGEIIGKVTFVSLPLGQIYFFTSSKVGTVVLVILPCSAVCIFEIAKIIYVLSESRREKKERLFNEEKDKKDKEIEELKRQLEEAKKGSLKENNEELKNGD